MPFAVIKAIEIHNSIQRLAATSQLCQGSLRHRAIGPALGQADAGLRHREQQTSEVAAVHRGDIGRLHHGQRARVIPVEQVAIMFGQLVYGVQCGFKPLREFARADPAKLSCATGGQQIQADVGWGCAVGYGGLGHQLQVVRRQMVVFRADAALEKAPGIAGQHFEVTPVLCAKQMRRVGWERQA